MNSALYSLDPGHAIATIIAVSLLIGIVLVSRKYIARQFGAGVAYMLWLVPVARLILPPLPSPVSVMNFMGVAATPKIEGTWHTATAADASAAPHATFKIISAPEAVEPMQTVTVNNVATIDFANADISQPLLGGYLLPVLLALWAGGALFMLMRSSWAHHSFMQTVRREADPVSPELARLAEQVARQVGLKRMPQVSSSLISAGPLVTGLFRPVILLPAWFEDDYDRTQQRAALAHELTHVKRGDLWALQLSEIFVAALWFNPLAYYARRAFRTDQEAACDSDVLKSGAATPHAYGQTLLKAVQISLPERLTAAASLPLTHALKERMHRMTNPTPSRSRRLMGASLASVLGGIALLGTASVTASAGETDSHSLQIIDGAVFLNGDEIKDRQVVLLNDPFSEHMPSPEIQAKIDELTKRIDIETHNIDGLMENLPEFDFKIAELDKELAGHMAITFSFSHDDMPKTAEEWEAWAEKAGLEKEAMAKKSAEEWEAWAETSAARVEEMSKSIEAQAATWEIEFQPKMKEFETRIEAYAAELESQIGATYGEEFEARMGATHTVIENLIEQCRDASLKDGETRVLESTADGLETPVKIACVRGGPSALKAKATIAAIKNNTKLGEKEKAKFMDSLEGGHHVEITSD